MRYSRQEIFIGTRNQKRLQKALVTIVGCGGTGSAAAEYLARAGVSLRLIDRDIVELSNIQRQLYREEDTGQPKSDALKGHLEDVNNGIKIESVPDDLNSSSIEKLIGSSLVLDGTDNMRTRFLMNDFCLKNKIPFTYGAAIKSDGLFTLIVPEETACLRCFVPDVSATDTCETAGVLGPVAGLIGTLSAAEAIKFLTGKECIKNQLFHVNVYKNKFELIKLKKNKDCPACNRKYEFLSKTGREVTQLCGGTYQVLLGRDINVSDVSDKLRRNREFKIVNSGGNHSQIAHKNCIVSLFRNRMIIQNAKNEKEVRTLAAKMTGL